MQRRTHHLRTLRAPGVLRACGILFVLLSLTLSAAMRAQAVIAAALPVISATASPSPSPSPTASPTPAPQMASGGPLRFSLTGGVTMGRSQRSSYDGNTTNDLSQTSETAGLLARVERDTASSRMVFTLPAGVSVHNTAFGVPELAYYTSKYGVLYGPQPLALLGGVPLGSTLQGFSFIWPIHGGDLTFYQGPALGPDDQRYRVEGALARTVLDGTLLEGGLTTGAAPDGDTANALLLGAARTSGALSQSFETSLERHDGAPSYAYQYLANLSGSKLSGTLTLRRIADGFVSFGGGLVQGLNSGDIALQDAAGPYNLSLDESLQDSSSEGLSTAQRRTQLYLTRSFAGGVSSAFSFTDLHQLSEGAAQWQGGPGLQTSFSFLGIQSMVSGQWLRTTSQNASSSSGTTYNGMFQHQFGPYNATLTLEQDRETGAQASKQRRTLFSFGRNLGSLNVSLNAQNLHLESASADSTQFSPTISVSKQITPGLALGFTYGLQFSHDPINPAFDGHARIFNVQIAAPFALGNGAVQGRVDPRLPATIDGVVLNENSSQIAAQSSLGSGVANVAVVLDNTTVARTDLSGHFQFNSVASGTHQVRLEQSSLPRGVLVDQPYATVTLQGGQQANLSFGVGTFGDIEGHVYGIEGDGEKMPVDNVTVQLDGQRTAQTDPLGAFGFGRLQPGRHTVQILVASLPASVGFSSASGKQQVDVQNGVVTPVDFVANPLGSVQGKIVYDPQLAPAYSGGVLNAYVVAEPGDYAVIADEDGSYYMDNLPAGTYTLDVDPETIPPNTGNEGGAQTVTIGPGEHRDNVDFTVGHQQKSVVFTFTGGQGANVAALALTEKTLPPFGTTPVSVVRADDAKSVVLHAFGSSQELHYDARAKAWTGVLGVPGKASAGPATIVAQVRGPHAQSASAVLTVNPQLPLATFTLQPRYPQIGQPVIVRARFVTDVKEGDRIRWLDGQITKLSRPVTGRVFQFTVKISEQPMRGFLLTGQGELPITLR